MKPFVLVVVLLTLTGLIVSLQKIRPEGDCRQPSTDSALVNVNPEFQFTCDAAKEALATSASASLQENIPELLPFPTPESLPETPLMVGPDGTPILRRD